MADRVMRFNVVGENTLPGDPPFTKRFPLSDADIKAELDAVTERLNMDDDQYEKELSSIKRRIAERKNTGTPLDAKKILIESHVKTLCEKVLPTSTLSYDEVQSVIHIITEVLAERAVKKCVQGS